MNAGKTGTPVGTRVRITKIVLSDPEDQTLVGAVGEITHPFPGLMVGDPGKYVAGLYLSDEEARRAQVMIQPLGGGIVNLTRGDEFEAERVFSFEVRDRQGERTDDYTVEVRAFNLREATVLAVEEAVYPSGQPDDEPTAQELIEAECGPGWTPEQFFEENPDLWRGDVLVSVRAPHRVAAQGDTPKEVMRRWGKLRLDNGEGARILDALNAVIDSLGNDEVERLFLREVHAQRTLEKG